MRGTSRLLLHYIHIIPAFHRDIMFISKVSLRNTAIFFYFYSIDVMVESVSSFMVKFMVKTTLLILKYKLLV